MSIEHWWQACYDKAVLAGEVLPVQATPQQELTLWQQVIEKNPASAALLRPRASAQLARDAYKNLLLWELDWRSEPLASQFRYDVDAQLFVEWAQSFEDELTARCMTVMPLLVDVLQPFARCEHIVLAEFNDLSPRYRRLLKQQAQSLQDYQFQSAPGEWQVQACDSEREELLQAGYWLAQNMQQQSQSSIGLLVPGLESRRESVLRLVEEGMAMAGQQQDGVVFAPAELPFNISAGVPLASCGPIRSALDLLSLCVESVEVPALVGLLNSRYRDNRELMLEQTMLHRLYRRGKVEVSPSLLRHECVSVETQQGGGLLLGQQLQNLQQRRDLKQRHVPSAWTALFSECLQALGWPGRSALGSVEYQQIEHWGQALKQLGELDAVCETLDYRSALQQLRQLAADAVFQPRTSRSNVQVLGLLEGAGLQFDHLWVCGMSSADWPPPANPNPFIPGVIQVSNRMPHANAERELDYARSLLQHFRQSGANMVASFCRQADDIELGPSPLLEYFSSACESGSTDGADQHETGARQAWSESWQQHRDRLSLLIHDSDPAPAVSAEEGTRLRGGSGLLADQSQCPFRAFTYHRLHIKPLPELGISLSASERGTILHEALHRLWGALEGSEALLALSAQDQEALVVRICEEAVASFRQGNPQPRMQSLLDLEQERLQPLLNQWLSIERERPPFSVAQREEAISVEIDELVLNLRLDRVDKLADGSLHLIDYKSGNSEVRQWMGERPEQPQLPLYSLALAAQQDKVSAISFALVSKKQLCFRGIGEQAAATGVKTDIGKTVKAWEPAPQDWASLRGMWDESLRQLAQQFVRGDAQVEPLDTRKTCSYCGLEGLCRIK